MYTIIWLTAEVRKIVTAYGENLCDSKCGNCHMTTVLYVAVELVPHCQDKILFIFLPSSPDSCHYLCWCSEGWGCESEDSSWLATGDPPLGPGPSSPLPGGGGYPPPTGREDAQSVQECWEGQRRTHIAKKEYCVFISFVFVSILFLFFFFFFPLIIILLWCFYHHEWQKHTSTWFTLVHPVIGQNASSAVGDFA